MTHYTDNNSRGPKGTQLELACFAQIGQFAQVAWHCTATHRFENHVVPRFRPDWQDTPTWRKKGQVPWEWVCPEPVFSMVPGMLVLVLGKATLTHVPPYETEPWDLPMLLVQRFEPNVKFGWVKAWDIEVPLLLRQEQAT